jgi:hypothetical protein
MATHWRVRAAAAILLMAGLSTVPARAAGHVDPTAINRDVDALVAKSGGEPAVSLWLGGASGPAWYARGTGDVRPTASAVKTFFLVELFARYHDHLDAPLPGADAVLADDDHPAISHFSSSQRQEIRRDLSGKSVRYVARAMMGQEKVSNAVYNAAANVVTAVLGGPDALTELIHRRDPAFRDVTVRRYMLRDRKTPGDNEATPASLAALYQRLSSKDLAGLDAATTDAIRDTLYRGKTAGLGKHYDKVGDLQSDPLTAVRAGWWETADGPVVYVVMVEQPTPGHRPRSAAGAAVSKLAYALTDRLAHEASPPISASPPKKSP